MVTILGQLLYKKLSEIDFALYKIEIKTGDSTVQQFEFFLVQVCMTEVFQN